MKKIVIWLVVAIVLISSFFVFQEYKKFSINENKRLDQEILFYKEIVDKEMVWINQLVLSNGAIIQRPKLDGTATINPYFASITARALLENGQYDDVKNYLEWHFDHLNSSRDDLYGVDGTIDDYNALLKSGILLDTISKNEYDSADSYAAMFLILIDEYLHFTDDKDYVLNNMEDINRVIETIYEHMNDNLSYASKGSFQYYIMDNAEVSHGLSSAISIYNYLYIDEIGLEQDQLIFYKELLNKHASHKQEINKSFYLPNEGYYKAEIDDESIDWNDFYPDAVGQLFPMIHGVVNPNNSLSVNLYDTFNSYYSWETMGHVTEEHATFYWGRLAYVAALQRDEHRLKTYIVNYERIVMEEHEFPIFNADVAWVVLACEEIIDYYESRQRLLIFR
jgi:hypothetical protein